MTSNLGDPRWAYTRGLHELGNDCWAWLQPDGGWGWSNAGLVVSQGNCLLIDTLFDLPLTRDMLNAMRRSVPASANIETLINTHANADHVNGNELVVGARIIASEACAAELRADDPERLVALMRAAPGMGEVGEFLKTAFGPFDFEGITRTLPTETFDRRSTVTVGEKSLELYTVGPAHTRGDILVHVPADRTVYTGDILFVGGHPIIWEGPVQNWIDACELIESFDVETVVPGHGPITTKRSATVMKEYFVYLRDETRKRFDAGLSSFEAAQDISFDDYSTWGDAERVAINTASLYREFRGGGQPEGILDRTELFAQMAQLARGRLAEARGRLAKARRLAGDPSKSSLD